VFLWFTKLRINLNVENKYRAGYGINPVHFIYGVVRFNAAKKHQPDCREVEQNDKIIHIRHFSDTKKRREIINEIPG